ncbi:hypothetical protein J4Q44_G00114920 [Coregonus suidteri]|uniref:Cadherin domain-containing protein n=1 Tax=Coregonus suidteri TaxID=861788 RepID=A0AAN8QZK1_9TELE
MEFSSSDVHFKVVSDGESSHNPVRTRGGGRRKRDWVIPPINVAENVRSPFPSPIVQIRSSNDNAVKMLYKITGQGADQPPVGRFKIERNTGWLSVTEPLDREHIYAHAKAEGMGLSEEPTEIIINVIDMNDNKPHFSHNPFLGCVPKAAEIDADEPGQDSSDILYSIRSQDPALPSNLFFINPVTGDTQVAAPGLDREACV